MRASKRHRPLARTLGSLPQGTDLSGLAERARYVGSPEHKDTPSFAGQPKPRADATICDRSFIDKLPQLNRWLSSALTRGAVRAPWEGDFPRYVWFKEGNVVYEARLVNSGTGEYKGYALEHDEWPRGIESHYESTD
jgi:hypothetical protein